MHRRFGFDLRERSGLPSAISNLSDVTELRETMFLYHVDLRDGAGLPSAFSKVRLA